MNEMCLDKNHDISLDGKSISRFRDSGALAVRQNVQTMLSTEEGEAFSDSVHGVPWLGEIAGLPISHLDVAKKIIRDKIKDVAGVRDIESVALVADTRTRNISGKFVVNTQYGRSSGEF